MFIIKSTDSSLKDYFAKPTRIKPICKDEISIALQHFLPNYIV